MKQNDFSLWKPRFTDLLKINVVGMLFGLFPLSIAAGVYSYIITQKLEQQINYTLIEALVIYVGLGLTFTLILALVASISVFIGCNIFLFIFNKKT